MSCAMPYAIRDALMYFQAQDSYSARHGLIGAPKNCASITVREKATLQPFLNTQLDTGLSGSTKTWSGAGLVLVWCWSGAGLVLVGLRSLCKILPKSPEVVFLLGKHRGNATQTQNSSRGPRNSSRGPLNNDPLNNSSTRTPLNNDSTRKALDNKFNKETSETSQQGYIHEVDIVRWGQRSLTAQGKCA